LKNSRNYRSASGAVIYGVRCTVKFASLSSVIDRFSCNKIFTLPLSGGEIVDLPPIAERERRDVLRDPEICNPQTTI
jgi:hypothetical protein